MEQRQAYRMLWKERADGGVCLVRLYAETGQAYLPSSIEGRPLLEIAPYCFSNTRPSLCGKALCETVLGDAPLSFLQELCGTNLAELTLPPSVKTIGSCAFYNCKNLKTLTVGSGLTEIGSDAFMNGISLRMIVICGNPGEESGVKPILSQISSDIEICFRAGEKTFAKLFYPEYYESYDEIAPAHLFGRSIRGEGFRARQCVKDKKIDFSAYDQVFLRACAEESELTLSRMAADRLQYPYALKETAKTDYRNYLKEHGTSFAVQMTKQKELDLLFFLCEENLISNAALARCIETAADIGWTEGAAFFLRQSSARRREKKDRYDFDDL